MDYCNEFNRVGNMALKTISYSSRQFASRLWQVLYSDLVNNV